MNHYELYGVTFEVVAGGEADEALHYLTREIQWETVERPRLEKWLATDEAKLDINYSDIYKDVYGHRPRY